MTPNVRFYSSENGAREVYALLEEEGFNVRSILLPSETEGREEEAVKDAIREGTLPERQIMICTRSLKEGRSLVGVRAPFGRGVDALELMETKDCVESDLLKRYRFNDPAPLSAMMGLPVLSKFVSSSGLVSSNWSFSAGFGLPLLSKNPAPFSSMFGMGTLSSTKKNWRTSFGFPLLSKSASPLSSMFMMPVLSRSKGPWKSSFGFPLLTRNPAPFSSLFGMTPLINDSTSAQVSRPTQQQATPPPRIVEQPESTPEQSQEPTAPQGPTSES
ncbi:MAG: hypothetical protein AAGB04_05460 [Pseudomonadota bacterium]